MKQFLLLASLTASTFFIQAQECNIIYVSPVGAASGAAGTKATPANFTYGLTLVSATNNRLWMAEGTYTIDNTISIPSNLTVEGGFNATNWIKSNATPTIINRTAANPDNANLALAAFQAVNQTGFRLQDLTINVANAPAASITDYGIRLSGCSNYNIVRCNITTGNGGAGQNGVAGANGTTGTNGANGQAGDDDSRNTSGRGGAGGGGGGGTAGGTGAVLGFGLGLPGALGGNGATPAPNRNGGGGGGGGCGAHDDLPGGAGGQGSSAFGNNTTVGTGGPGGGGCCDQNNNNCANPRLNGTNGANGADGANGTVSASGVAAHNAGFFVPGTGVTGVDGFGGQGGAGGGGGSGDKGLPSAGCAFSGCSSGTGCGGGGGGGGGQGGTGGTGGTGGGGSFPIYLHSNGANGNLTDNLLTPGAAGNGGAGGAGGTGAIGGTGGARGTANAEIGCGGTGGNGGRGGNGGTGGNGSNGESLAIYQNGTAPAVTGNAVPGNPPVISVLNSGCVNQTILFQAPASGNWNFGAGASPVSATGAGPLQVSYNSLGRKTITFNGTVFTEFIDIFNSAAPVNNIITANTNPIVAGCPASFTSTLAGSFHEWKFQPAGVIPDSVAGAANQTVTGVTFSAPGTYNVILRVATPTSCCGFVSDTLQLTVVPNTSTLTIAFQPTTICSGQSVTFTAQAGFQQYTFFLNNTPVQQSASNTYTTSALNPGDIVTVAGFDGNCYTNPSSDAVVTFSNPPTPTLSSSDADNIICAGESITFTASPNTFTNYIFSVNGTAVQTSAASTFTTSNLTNGSSINVVGDNGNCNSLPSTPIVVQVITVNKPSAGNDLNVCSDDAVTALNGTPAGGNWTGTGISGTNFDPAVSGAGVFSLVYNVFDPQAGCNASDSAIATVTLRPAVNAGNDFSVCTDTIAFALQGFSPAGGAWSGTGVNALGNFDPASAGTGTFTLTYNIGGACPASSNISATVNASPAVNAGNGFGICIDAAPLSLPGFSPAGGTWSGNGVDAAGTFSPAGNTGVRTLTYTVVDPNNGCRGNDDLAVTVNGLPFVIAGQDVAACEGEAIQLSASGASTYSWNPATDLSNPTVANPVFTANATNTFTVTGTDANGCVNTDDVTITVGSNATADFSFEPECAGEEVLFQNLSVGATNYLWNFGNGTTSTDVSPVVIYNTGGTFTVTLTASVGNCSDDTTQTIAISDKPIANFTATQLTLVQNETGLELTNNSTGATAWFWTFGDSTVSSEFEPLHFYSQKGLYNVSLIATSSGGCSDTLTKFAWVKVVEKPALYVPNLFSPNDDGVNDFFKIEGSGFKQVDLKIFNRWGEKVFETDNANIGWDGYFSGEKAEPGVYVYHLTVLYDVLSSTQYTGSIILVR